MALLWFSAGFALLLAYLWHANRAVSTAPVEALKLSQKPWTKDEIREEYRRAQRSPTDVTPFLFTKKDRRYIVTGGSGKECCYAQYPFSSLAIGLVGGWIVAHLLMRGEDPAAIRILDLSPPRRKEVSENNITYIQTDVGDPKAVQHAFDMEWPDHVKSLPLTVFHCVAYINACDRTADFLSVYEKVNIRGTENVLKAAQAAAASCFVATSSASVGLKPPTYFPWPWQRLPSNIWQLIPNAEPATLDGPLEAYGSCYAWSKARAEKLVRQANDPKADFLTGAIRPGHAIYGHGVENASSITFDYLRRGGSPSWIRYVVANFVNCQNVSIGHLAYEDALINGTNPGGKGYCVTDPNPPIQYGFLYQTLETLAHPLTPIAFPYIPHMAMLLPSYVFEAYRLLQHRYLSFLPKIAGDLAYIQPAMFNMCTLHTVYTDTAAQEEIGYRAPIRTLEGFALAVLDWNQKVEEKANTKIEQGRGEEVEVQHGTSMPKAPNVH